jgi:Zn ribbon nucleic-acid-binding protein
MIEGDPQVISKVKCPRCSSTWNVQHWRSEPLKSLSVLCRSCLALESDEASMRRMQAVAHWWMGAALLVFVALVAILWSGKS